MATAATAVPPVVVQKLGATLGASYLGAMGAAMLFGITNLQTYFYFRNYKQDWIFQKCMVVYLWLLDTIHMAFVIAHLWHYLIDSFGNYRALMIVTWSYRLQMTTTVIIIASVQSLYTWRAWKLSQHKSRFWPWTLTIVLITVYASGTILMVETYAIVTISEAVRTHWSIYLALAMCTFADILLTVGMCYLLYLGRTTFVEMKSTVGILLRYVLISGAFTSAGSIAALTTFCAMSNTSVALGIVLVLAKVYTNSYLAMLNARKSIRNTMANTLRTSDVELKVPAMDIDSKTFSAQTESQVRAEKDQTGVKVKVDVVRQYDEARLYVP